MEQHNYQVIIGLEIHAQLKTKRKMFCCCINDTTETTPNRNICPVCMGHPGALPIPNAKAIEWTQSTGLATKCTLAANSKFDRKHYFYPDLPKGYQISQYDQPFCENGKLYADGKEVAIVRIHLEEDTAKLFHEQNKSLIDYNRAGAPLMELVTAPTIESAGQASNFCKQYQHILRTLGISDANMERGEMRCEANISVQEKGSFEFTKTTIKPKKGKTLNNKVEIKNLNSFKSVEKAIQYEMIRQIELIEADEEIAQETRGWDDTTQTTVSQRLKESAHDYRYFPEPDIPPLLLTQEQMQNLQQGLPELPNEKIQRFQEEYGLSEQDAKALNIDKHTAVFFEHVISEAGEWTQALKEGSEEITKEESKSFTKLTSNWILSELFGLLNERDMTIQEMKISPENFAELMVMLKDGKINSSAGQTILLIMLETEGDPSEIAERKNLLQESNTDAISIIVHKVIDENPDAINDLKAGNERAMKHLMGQVMKESQGKANPKMAEEIIRTHAQ